MKRIPLYDETATISCSLTPEEIPARLATIERMRGELASHERTDHGLLLHFPPSASLEAELRQFAVDEKRCCQFWGFEVRTADATGLALVWEAPPSAAELVDQLEAFFLGDEPAEMLAGLL
jgi:hypothetical protein